MFLIADAPVHTCNALGTAFMAVSISGFREAAALSAWPADMQCQHVCKHVCQHVCQHVCKLVCKCVHTPMCGGSLQRVRTSKDALASIPFKAAWLFPFPFAHPHLTANKHGMLVAHPESQCCRRYRESYPKMLQRPLSACRPCQTKRLLTLP